MMFVSFDLNDVCAKCHFCCIVINRMANISTEEVGPVHLEPIEFYLGTISANASDSFPYLPSSMVACEWSASNCLDRIH